MGLGRLIPPAMLGLAMGLVAAAAQASGRLVIALDGLAPGARLPASTLFCPDPSSPDAPRDISPAVSWSRGPPATRSYAIVMSDLDVPKDLRVANQAGVIIPARVPRVTFIHWVLIDIPPNLTHLARGAESQSPAPGDHALGPTDHGLRGANVYSGFYPKGSPLAGPRGGFDGPCPPRNDLKPHRYRTTIYALDVATLGLSEPFFGETVLDRIKDHVLAEGETTETFSFSEDRRRPGVRRPPLP